MRNLFNRKAADMKAGDEETQVPDQDTVLDNESAVEDAASENIESVPTANPGSDAANKLLRLQADFDNFRRRSSGARQEGRDEARREMLLGLLSIYDNFLRALLHAGGDEGQSSFLSGIQGIRLQFEEFFRRQGLEAIPAAEGTLFDPNLHEATGALPAPEGRGNSVAQELIKGFVYKGQVLRPAQVLVYAEE